jgi:cell wall-associated NlpC family hydrolase
MYYSLKKYMIGSSIKSLNKAEVGDIIFFKRGGRVCHVGIYYGDGNMINAANARRDICIESVRDWNSWGYKVVGIARVLKD